MQTLNPRPALREPRHRSPGPWAISLREFIAKHHSHALVLEPPYHGLVSLNRLEPTYRPPLGAIAIGAGHDLFTVVSEVWLIIQQWSWVVPCIALAPDQWQSEPLLKLVPDFSSRLAIGKIQSTPEASLRAITSAVRRRPFPTPHVLARWVSERIASPAYYSLLLAQFEHALHGTPARGFSLATASRHFARLGRYTARDWRALASLSVELCAVASTADPLLLRGHHGGHIRKYLKVPVKTAAALLGWEWVLDQALRTGGYVPLAEEHRVPYSVKSGHSSRSRHS